MANRPFAATLAAVLACGLAAAAGAPGRSRAADHLFPGSQYLDEQQRLQEEAARQGRPVAADKLAGIYRRWFAALLRPRLGTASRDASALSCFIQDYTIWRARLKMATALSVQPPGALPGLLAPDVAAALSAIERGFAIGYRDAVRRCTRDRHPSKAWVLLRLYRARDLVHKLFAEDERAPHLDWLPRELSACLRFEVAVHSTMDGSSPDGRARIRHSLDAETLVVLLDEPLSGSLDPGPSGQIPEGGQGANPAPSRGTARLSSVGAPVPGGREGAGPSRLVSEWSSRDPGFGEDRKEEEGRFEVEEMDVQLHPDAFCDGGAGEPKWFLSYGIYQGPMDSEHFLTFYWRDFHREESMALRGSMNSYRASGFQRGSGDVFVQTTYRQTKPAGGYLLTEDTRIEVRHAPR